VLSRKHQLLAGTLALAVVSALGLALFLIEPTTISCVEGYQVKHNAGGNNLVRGLDGHAVKCKN
jgi:hypothetical protein